MSRRVHPCHGSSPLLPLDYHPAVPARLLAQMERAARRLGLPLETLEVLGQDAERSQAFVEAARRGTVAAFLRNLAAPRAPACPWPPSPTLEVPV